MDLFAKLGLAIKDTESDAAKVAVAITGGSATYTPVNGSQNAGSVTFKVLSEN